MIRAKLAQQDTATRRVAIRRLVNFGAPLRQGGTTSDAVVLDLSATGFLMHHSAQLDLHGELWIKLPGLGARQVRVVRHDGDPST
jgi:hypothetical protein